MRLVRFLFPKPYKRDIRLDHSILMQAASFYGLKADYLTPVRNGASFVYSYSGTCFLKITSSVEQSFERILQTCKWQSYLSNQTPLVAPILHSFKGNLAEKIDGDSSYHTVVLYEKAQGNQVTGADWNTNVFLNIGKLTGSLHRLAKNYNGPVSHLPEYHLHVAGELGNYLPADNKRLMERFTNLLKVVSKLPVSANNHGIIHNDIHRGNLSLSGEHLQLFDFDDTCHSWFINDISNIFYNALLNEKRDVEASKEYLDTFKSYFWRGYNPENSLPLPERDSLPVWLALRAILCYAFLIKAGEQDNYNPTLRAYFLLNEKYAMQELEQLKPEMFY